MPCEPHQPLSNQCFQIFVIYLEPIYNINFMERKIAIVLFLFIFCTMAYSQDILTMKSGEQSVVKIEGISDEVITLNCGLI